MERDVMDIIKEKEFIELTPNERVELRDLCSTEDEFNQMKSLFVGMDAVSWSNPTPRSETKESLDALFQQKHPKASPIWYNSALAVVAPKEKPFYRQPLVQAAAIGLLFLFAYPFVSNTKMDSEVNQVATVDVKEVEPKQTTSEKPTEKNKQTAVSPQTDNTRSAETIANNSVSASSDVTTRFDRDATVSRTVSSEVIAAVPAPVSGSALRVTSGSAAAQPGTTHPDGIFMEDRAQLFSAPASREPAIFDLLTSTF